jgi:hypothetical protein
MPAALSERIDALLKTDAYELDRSWTSTNTKQLLQDVQECCCRAFADADAKSEFIVQKVLSRIYMLHVSIPQPGERNGEGSVIVQAIRNLIEDAFLQREERAASTSLLDGVPCSPSDYQIWLCRQIQEHPAYTHPLFDPYLSECATADDLRYFMAQESTIDASTDDFLALVQLGATGRVKMEIASNYWDEMGNGNEASVHSHLFAIAARSFGIDMAELDNCLETEALACGNLQLMLSLRRRYFHKAIGYFLVAEYMVPRRFENWMVAWRRNKLSLPEAGYYEAHITIDKDHSERWFRNVITPVVREHPAAAEEIARGAIYRLNSSKRYLDRVFSKFPSRNLGS